MTNKLYYQAQVKVPKHMAYLDAKFINKKQKAATSNIGMKSKTQSSMSLPQAVPADSSGSRISPRNGFHIKFTPMQLYPKMLKVKVIDKQLGKKF